MIEPDLILYSTAVATVVRGHERPRAKVVAMLGALDLTGDQADEVIRYGVARALFTEDPTASILRAPSSAPVDRLRDAFEEATEDQATILRIIEESLPVVVWVADRQGVFLHHAGKGLAAAGLAEGQFLGMSILEIYAGTKALEAVKQAYAGNLIHSYGEGHGVIWENWYIPVHGAEGELTSIIGLSLDVTDAKRAERALKDRLELIERQQEMIRALSTPIIEVWDTQRGADHGLAGAGPRGDRHARQPARGARALHGADARAPQRLNQSPSGSSTAMPMSFISRSAFAVVTTPGFSL